jgi:hypothetical protein
VEKTGPSLTLIYRRGGRGGSHFRRLPTLSKIFT